jgi:hypothetical protein
MIEAFLPEQVGRNERLERIDEVVDWNEIAKLVENIYSAREGKPIYTPLMMVKVLILQQWYNSSDPEMEAALLDQLSFRRFVGLAPQDDSPDHSTISRFRKQLTDRGVGATTGQARSNSQERDFDGRDVRGSPGPPSIDVCRSQEPDRPRCRLDMGTDGCVTWGTSGTRQRCGSS